MADPLLETEILAACSSIGYNNDGKYNLEADHLDTIKDLLRYLRKDDDAHNIRRALGEARVVQNDLVPIIINYNDNSELFDVTIRLLVVLTNPVLLLYKEELPEEKVARCHYMQILYHQQDFKKAFANKNVWEVFGSIVKNILSDIPAVRSEEDTVLLERILILARNILSVASNPEDEKRTDDDASIHDQVLWAIHLSEFEDLLLYMASTPEEYQFCLHILELVSLILKEQDPALLAMSGLQRSQTEKEKDEQELKRIRELESLKKAQQNKKRYNARHSRFGGTYCVANLQSISDKNLIIHKHFPDLNSIEFGKNKQKKRQSKNLRPFEENSVVRQSTLAVRLFLQKFCVEFLSGSYNKLMSAVRDQLSQKKAQDHDESYYVWAIKFFLAFNRNHNFKLHLVSESMNIQEFHYLQTLFETNFEMIAMDKKKVTLWSRRMHRVLRAYQELFLTLHFMDKSKDASVRESSHILKCRLFYVVEYRELPLKALQNYEEKKMSKLFLKDLIETAYIFLKLLESVCGRQKHMIVQRKVKQKKSGKKSVTKKWEAIAEPLSEILEQNLDDVNVQTIFDPASDSTELEQRIEVAKSIYSMLISQDLRQAAATFRAARQTWPDNDMFGVPSSIESTEIDAIKEFFLKDKESEFSDDEEEDKRHENISEQEFNFQDFVHRFSHMKVLQAHALLFKRFFTNSEHTNHCILKMFHRIAWESKMPAIFFQLSIFQTFQKILDYPSSSSQSIIDAKKFATFIIGKFFELSQTNNKVFIELLFWKTNVEAIDMENNYSGINSSRDQESQWTEEENNELRQLVEEFNSSEEVENAHDDMADYITKNLIKTRSRRMVIKQLKELNIINNVKELKKKSKSSRSWDEVEELELVELFHEYKETDNPIARIMEFKLVERSRGSIVNKLLKLGLIKDKSEVCKKRFSKSSSKHGGSERHQSSSEDEERDSDSDLSDAEPVDTSPPVTASVVQIKESLAVVKEKGFVEALEWLSELLDDTANDREEDGDFQPVPLLALGESATQALGDENFKYLLSCIGLQKPIHLKEMFWKIPSSMSVHGLRERAKFLKGNETEITDASSYISPQNRRNQPEAMESSDSEDEMIVSQTKSQTKTNILREANHLTNEKKSLSTKPRDVDTSSQTVANRTLNDREQSSDSDDELIVYRSRSQANENPQQNSVTGNNVNGHSDNSLDSDVPNNFKSIGTKITKRATIDDSDSENEVDKTSKSMKKLELPNVESDEEMWVPDRKRTRNVVDSDGEDNMISKVPRVIDSDSE